MKYLFLITFLTSCGSLGIKIKDFNPNIDGKGFNIIKYYKFGNLSYDTFESVEVNGSYVKYITPDKKTNTISGDFQLYYNKK